MSFRLGVDVGGTFTDVLLVNSDSGETWRTKTASTPEDQSVGVLRGIEKVCADAGIAPHRHRPGAARHHRRRRMPSWRARVRWSGWSPPRASGRCCRSPGLSSQAAWPAGSSGPSRNRWPRWRTPSRCRSGWPLTARWSPRWTSRRPGADSAPCKDKGIQALAISLINAFANGDHEERIAAIAAEELPGIPISRSSVVLARDARVRAGADHGGEQLCPAAGGPVRPEPVHATDRAGCAGRAVHPAQ